MADYVKEDTVVATFIQALMGAEADLAWGAAFGERSPDRVNRRNGYCEWRLDTRIGTIELAIPKQRQGSYFRTGCWSLWVPESRFWVLTYKFVGQPIGPHARPMTLR